MKMWAFELDWTAKMMDTIIPPGVEDKFPQSASETGAVKILDEMVQYTPFITAFGLRAAIWLIEFFGPLISSGRPRRFSKLEPASREQVLKNMYQSKVYLIRQLVLLIKMTACFGWGASPGVRKALGAEGEPKFVKRGAK